MVTTSRKTSFIFCSLVLNGLCSHSFASNQPEAKQTISPTEKNSPVSQKVEIQGNKEYDERKLETVSKIVITSDEILKYGDGNVTDVLKRLPGITLSGAPGRGGSIRMRGLSGGYLNIMLDGEPVPSGFSLESLNPNLIEKIEIIRSATAEYSTQALAGSINIVLKKKIQTSKRQLKAYTQLENGKNSNNLTLDVSNKLNDLSYLIVSSFTHSDFLRPTMKSVEESFDNNGQVISSSNNYYENRGRIDSANIAPRINFKIGDTDTISSQNFINYYQFSGNQSQTTDNIIGLPPSYLLSKQNIGTSATIIQSNLNWLRKLPDSAKLETKFGVTFNKTNASVLTNGYNEQSYLALKRFSKDINTDKGLTFNAKYSVPFVEAHAFVVGMNSTYNLRDEDIKLNEEKHSLGLTTDNSAETLHANVATFAFFAQDEWEISKQLSIYSGVRWEGIKTISSGTNFAEIQNKSSIFSPILQVLWKLPSSKNDQFRLGIAKTYKAPQLGKLLPKRELIADVNNSPITPEGTGNPNLRPELSLGLDIAYEHYFSEGGMFSVSSYFRHVDDVVQNIITNVNGVWVAIPINNGNATVYGFESEIKLPIQNFLKSGPAVDLRANLNINKSRVSGVPGPYNRLDSQTPFSGNVAVDYKVQDFPLNISFNYGFQSGGNVQISPSDSRYTSPKRTLDISALWKYDKNIQIRASISNLLHQDFVNKLGYRNSSSQQFNTQYTPSKISGRLFFDITF